MRKNVDIYDRVSLLQTLVEKVAAGGRIYAGLRRELDADRRLLSLEFEGHPVEGSFDEARSALIEEAEGLRKNLCYLGDFSQAREMLCLMAPLCGKQEEPDLRRLEPARADGFRIAAEIMFAWGELSRLCDLDDLPAAQSSSETLDPVADGLAQRVPSEERLKQIVASGITCVGLLKEFCSYRGIETR